MVEVTEKLVKNKFLNESGHKRQISNRSEVFKRTWFKRSFFYCLFDFPKGVLQRLTVQVSVIRGEGHE